MPSTWRRSLARARFTITAALGAALLLGLIFFAIYDSVSSAQSSTRSVQESTLAAELSNFLLSLREPDGTSLLDNPSEFSLAQRHLYPVNLKRSFYSYLLNRANARSFTVDKISWEPPRACLIRFPSLWSDGTDKLAGPVDACLAVVTEDVGGRFVYFSLRFPSQGIRRHTPGQDINEVDRVVLNFDAARPVAFILVFQAPSLASARYPSQMKRFSGLHEMVAYPSSAPSRPVRQVNAQAFERVDDATGHNYVTVVGRIDAGLIDGPSSSAPVWPTREIKQVSAGLQVLSAAGAGSTSKVADILPGTAGSAVVSIQKAYLANVGSGSRVDIYRGQKGIQELLWSSSSVSVPEPPRRTGWTQRLSDWWAPKLMSLMRKQPLDEQMSVQQQFSGFGGDLRATATSATSPLPDVATRAFGWLSAAFILTFALVIIAGVAVIRLLHVTRSAWSMTVSMNYSMHQHQRQYGRKRDEISTLGRVLNLLLARSRSRNQNLMKRIGRERADLHLAGEHLKLRQDRLDAIGHEIRSPLQALLNRSRDNADLREQLLRMERAVEALFQAESVEDGISSLEIVLADTDVAEYLDRLVTNKQPEYSYLRYEGPQQGLFALVDPIRLEQVIDHLLDNAQRYRKAQGAVTVSLRAEVEDVTIEVFNEGSSIPQEKLESVFKYRNSDRSTPRNRGLGLFAARAYLLAMKATIRAENRPAGVAMVIALRKARSAQPVI